ncbi:glutathione S-transferase family protein [Sphingomonas sp. MA1305]|uniref:glutathione S-transferase family protein n=1 Tax=Sphingomonas sp. MA1305 TaxID=2479204 RepID=UPI0018DF27B9|nr:glutathione S-transferase family protein [Sphingomonas sp. MA1305]
MTNDLPALPPVYENPYDRARIDADGATKLYRFAVGNPDVARHLSTLSPPSTKLEAYFRLFGIPYEVVPVQGTEDAPRGKVPYILAGDVKLTDSDLIIGYLKRTQADPDAGLSAAQWATGHLVQRMLEDHLYWIVIYYEFCDDAGWDFLLRASVGDPSVLPPAVIDAFDAIRADRARRCYDQGIARYTPEEIVEKARKDLLALSEVLGDNDYLLGTEQPTSFDAMVVGMTLGLFQARAMHPEISDIARGLPNLSRYMHRMLAAAFPDLEPAFDPA